MKANIEKMTRAAFTGNDPAKALEPTPAATPPPTPPLPDLSTPPTPPVTPPAADPKAAATPPATPTPTEFPAPKSKLLDALAKKEAPPPAAPAEEIPGPEDALSLPDDASPEKKSQFTQMKTMMKQLRRDIAAKEKLLETKAAPAEQKELETLKAERKILSDRLAVLDVQNHPDFRKQFIVPRDAAIAEAKEVLSYTAGKEGTDLPAILAKNPKDFAAAVAELTKDMNGMDAGTVQTAMRTAYKLQAESQQQMARASELAQQLSATSSMRQKEAFNEISAKLGPIGEVLVTLDIPSDAPAEEKQAIAEYNRSVSEVKANAERLAFGEMDAKGAASLAWKGATLDFLLNHGMPRIEREYKALLTSHNQMAAELQAIKTARSPGSAPPVGDPATPPKTSAPPGSRQSINDLVKATFAGAR